MSKAYKDDEETPDSEQKDVQTAKFLHKLAEKGKERGIPESLIAYYEEGSWEATKSEEKRKNCEKCGMPPPPPIDASLPTEPSKTCRNCGEVNKSAIGTESDLMKSAKIAKSAEKIKKAPKRPAPQVYSNAPDQLIRPSPRKVAQPPPHCVVPAPLLQSKSAAKKAAKKVRVAPQKEPEFLQKLFGIGAKPAGTTD